MWIKCGCGLINIGLVTFTLARKWLMDREIRVPTLEAPSEVDEIGEVIPTFRTPSLACGEIASKHAEGLVFKAGEPSEDE